MLGRRLRLRDPQDFAQIYKKGQRLSGPHLRVFYLPNNQNLTRFGFVVSKKQVRQIVKRNRLKRVLREKVRQNLASFPLGYDFIIQIRSAAVEVSSTVLQEELLKLFSKAKHL